MKRLKVFSFISAQKRNIAPIPPFKISSNSPIRPVVQCLIGSYRNLSTSFLSWHQWQLATPTDLLPVLTAKYGGIKNAQEKLGEP